MPIGLRYAVIVRARLRGRGHLAACLARLSIATLGGRLGRALIGIVLAVHLVGGPGLVDAAQMQAANDAASLSAAIGQPIQTCHHSDPDAPDLPSMPGGCDHCICCQPVSIGIALGAAVVAVPAPARSPQRLAYPMRENAVVRSRRAGRTAARGPPELS